MTGLSRRLSLALVVLVFLCDCGQSVLLVHIPLRHGFPFPSAPAKTVRHSLLRYHSAGFLAQKPYGPWPYRTACVCEYLSSLLCCDCFDLR
uniref:Putative secreted protein n=1 Tax=Anopheles marajoara TaxID=58244 RepID=A0A2M4CAB1_9DIPT